MSFGNEKKSHGRNSSQTTMQLLRTSASHRHDYGPLSAAKVEQPRLRIHSKEVRDVHIIRKSGRKANDANAERRIRSRVKQDNKNSVGKECAQKQRKAQCDGGTHVDCDRST